MLSEIKKIDLQKSFIQLKRIILLRDFHICEQWNKVILHQKNLAGFQIILGELKIKLIAFLPLYKKFNSYGEFIFDHQWANALE